MQLKVMCYNTWLGNNIKGIAKHIANVNPDVVGLQEIMEDYPNNGNPCTAFTLNDILQKKYHRKYFLSYFPAFESDRHTSKRTIGNAVLSKSPFTKSQVHVLSSLEAYLKRSSETTPRDAEPRVAIETSIKVGRKTLCVINVHMGVSENLGPTKYRDTQFNNLLKLIGDGNDAILMGDFNATPDSSYIKQVEQKMTNTDKYQNPTWPFLQESLTHHHACYGKCVKDIPLLTHRIDQIFVGKGLETVSFKLGKSKASDHRSLIANIRI